MTMNIYDLYIRDALATQAQEDVVPAIVLGAPWWLQSTPWFVVGGAFAAGFVIAILVF